MTKSIYYSRDALNPAAVFIYSAFGSLAALSKVLVAQAMVNSALSMSIS